MKTLSLWYIFILLKYSIEISLKPYVIYYNGYTVIVLSIVHYRYQIVMNNKV